MSNADLSPFSSLSNGLHHKHHNGNGNTNGLMLYGPRRTVMAATPATLQEVDESELTKDKQGYPIENISTDSSLHQTCNTNGCTETENIKYYSVDRLNNQTTTMHDTRNGSLSELSHTTKPIDKLVQKTQAECAIDTKRPIVKKPRPNSLAILSRSHDLIYTAKEEEVSSESSISNHRAALYGKSRAASADNLLQQMRPGLQQRRNQRPTSLLIPNILDVPPEIIRTAHPYIASSNDLSFTSHAPTTRPRSYSVPSTTVLEVRDPAMAVPSHSLDEALALLTKKKIGRTEIDAQSLLHRAADAGHVKLAKKCIQAGCTVIKQLNSLNGTSALHCAARADKNSAQVTKLLLETGMVDVNTKNDLGETAIFSAIIHKNMDTVDVLVEYGCDINSVWQKSTPLYLMLCNKDMEASFKAINQGARITVLTEEVRQPLHAVLDVCHMSAITFHTMNLLRLMIQADGDVVKHLDSYICSRPGNSDQDIVYHIYRLEKGPLQNEGKQLIRSLVKLGYTPTRGELATMSQSDDDYDYLYSYIKCGPAPLKDLCTRAVRKSCKVNVTYAMDRWKPAVREAEKLQILLHPPAPPDHDYENVQVIRRNKDTRRSRHKSLKEFMSGIGRFSRKFSKKNTDTDMHVQLSLPNKELETKSAPSVAPKPAPRPTTKPPIKPKPNKSKYQKRESQKGPKVIAVADIVNRYTEPRAEIQTADEVSHTIAVDNPAYIDNESVNNHVGSIAVTDDSRVEHDETSNHVDADVIVKFHEDDTDSRIIRRSGQRAQTPMTDHAPDISSRLTYKASIHIEDDEAM